MGDFQSSPMAKSCPGRKAWPGAGKCLSETASYLVMGPDSSANFQVACCPAKVSAGYVVVPALARCHYWIHLHQHQRCLLRQRMSRVHWVFDRSRGLLIVVASQARSSGHHCFQKQVVAELVVELAAPTDLLRLADTVGQCLALCCKSDRPDHHYSPSLTRSSVVTCCMAFATELAGLTLVSIEKACFCQSIQLTRWHFTFSAMH